MSITSGLPFSTVALAASPKVIVSIKPIHSLVSMVMEGVGEPELLLQGKSSPHHYSLRPSEASALQNAEIVFWVGPNLETFLVKPIHSLASKATKISLFETHGLTKYELRGHDDDHEHGHSDHDHDTESSKFDPHIWLDPDNARLMVERIADVLIDADPQNREIYVKNRKNASQELSKLTDEVQIYLEAIKGKPFFVFHDAYQGFENRFDLLSKGAISLSPEVKPGAAHITELKEKLVKSGAKCVFSEPQFSDALANTVIEGTNAKIEELDPIGANLDDGPKLYIDLIEGLARSFRNCLDDESSN